MALVQSRSNQSLWRIRLNRELYCGSIAHATGLEVPIPRRAPLERVWLEDPERRRSMAEAAASKVRRQFDVGVCEKPFHDRVLELVKQREKD